MAAENARHFQQLSSPIHTYKALDMCNKEGRFHMTKFQRDCQHPEESRLRVGAQVLLLVNLDLDRVRVSSTSLGPGDTAFICARLLASARFRYESWHLLTSPPRVCSQGLCNGSRGVVVDFADVRAHPDKMAKFEDYFTRNNTYLVPVVLFQSLLGGCGRLTECPGTNHAVPPCCGTRACRPLRLRGPTTRSRVFVGVSVGLMLRSVALCSVA